jgi:hypothetical protein
MLRMEKDGLIQLHLQIVTKATSAPWNEYIQRYHYLGHSPLPGALLRCFITAGNQIVALTGFGAAAWQTAPRDQFIGWGHDHRKKNLHLIVNNARFLILPWIQSKNLASKILFLMIRTLPDDWERRYNIRPVLMLKFPPTFTVPVRVTKRGGMVIASALCHNLFHPFDDRFLVAQPLYLLEPSSATGFFFF